MGARLIYNSMILSGSLAGGLVLLRLLAGLLAALAKGRGGSRWDRLYRIYFPKMENDCAEADNRDLGDDRRHHLPKR